MTEAWLPGEGICENGESIICLSQVRGIDLACVAGEHHFCSLSNSCEDRSQRRGFKVLGFVDHNHLLLK